MRWIHLNCILFASFAILSATNGESSKHKRDLTFVKNIIKSAVFGNENKTDPKPVNNDEDYKIFRIPGFNNILVKAVPKTANVAAVPEKVEVLTPISISDEKVGVVASYLGTESHAETLKALQGVKALLNSGILTATKDVSEAVSVGTLPPHLQLVAIGEGTVESPHILLDTATICDDAIVEGPPAIIPQPTVFKKHPLMSIFNRPVIPFPNVFKPVSPVKPVVPVPVVPTTYSYKQIHNNGGVTTYTANDNHNVIVTESDEPVPLPPFVTYRIDEVMKSGVYGVEGAVTRPVFSGHIQRPTVQHFYSTKINPYHPIGSNYFYKQIHNDGTATTYSSSNKNANVIITETEKVPSIPAFITNRIEKVAATAVTGKQPNINILSGLPVAPTFVYRPPFISYPNMDIRGDMKIVTKEHKDVNLNSASKNEYSYKIVHKDGTVTNHYHDQINSVFKKPIENSEIAPVSPPYVESNLQNIAKTSGGSFSYKILHNDGSVTNYGVIGVHEGIEGGKKIVPIEKTTTNIPTTGSFTYKINHSDGSVSSYSNTGRVDEKVLHGTTKDATNEGKNRIGSSINEAVNKYISSDTKKPASHLTVNDIHSQNFNQPQGSFSYKSVHSDGSMTIYSKNGVEDVKNAQKSALDRDESHKFSSATEANEHSAKINIQVTAPENSDISTVKQDIKQFSQLSSQNNAASVPGSFSYKAVHADGSTTIYSQNGVSEKNTAIKQANQQSFKATDVHPDISKVAAGSFSYKTIHSDGSETNFSGHKVEEIKRPNYNHAPIQPIIKADAVQTNLHYEEKPSGSFSYKTVQSDGSTRNDMKSVSLQQNVQNQNSESAGIDVSILNEQTQPIEVMPSAPELPEISNENLAVVPGSVLVEDSKKVLFAKPIVSTYSYKQIHHNVPDQFTVAVNVDDSASNRISGHVAAIGHSIEEATVDTIPKDYLYIPPATTKDPPPIKPLVSKEEEYNTPTAVILTPMEEVPCVEKSLSEHPIVVLDEPMKYSYEHRKVDGSAVFVDSDQSTVSASISPMKEHVKNRGDIP